MLANLEIPTLENDQKLVIGENHLGSQILYIIPNSLKKTASIL